MEKPFPIPHGVSIKRINEPECFARNFYIYRHHGHRKDRDKASHDLYDELEPLRRRQPSIERQNTDFDKE